MFNVVMKYLLKFTICLYIYLNINYKCANDSQDKLIVIYQKTLYYIFIN